MLNLIGERPFRGVGCVGNDPAFDEAENMDEGKGGLSC